MARPIRIEYAGALYHVTSRGDRREDIYLNDENRTEWLEVLGQTCQAEIPRIYHAGKGLTEPTQGYAPSITTG